MRPVGRTYTLPVLPTLEGTISRRILLNYWVDPEVARRLIPAPLEPAIHDGHAVAGICLIRLEHLRPKHLPKDVGISSENMAHRIAIRYPGPDGMVDGVFIMRRETDRGLITALGGRLFPGVHGRARFDVDDGGDRLSYAVRTGRGEADVGLRVRVVDGWKGSPLFPSFEGVRDFFARGDRGFSCSLRGDELEGMRLRTIAWDMTPLEVEDVTSSFYDDPARFPEGSIGLDGAVLMRGIAHEWHELRDVPELADLAP
jgi:hypothetical protein